MGIPSLFNSLQNENKLSFVFYSENVKIHKMLVGEVSIGSLRQRLNFLQ